MFAEKLAKAYQYGKAMPATKSHTGFRRFLKSLGSEPKIWKELRFSRLEDFEKHLDEMNHLAIEIESLAPANAGRGRNPEYPWPPPPDPPAQCPAEFDFPLWTTLTTTERGQKFLVFLRAIARIFPQRF